MLVYIQLLVEYAGLTTNNKFQARQPTTTVQYTL